MTKIYKCSKCCKFKFVDQFRKNKSLKEGVQQVCLECNKTASNEWFQLNQSYKQEYMRNYRAGIRLRKTTKSGDKK
jgi:hypothetical protein